MKLILWVFLLMAIGMIGTALYYATELYDINWIAVLATFGVFNTVYWLDRACKRWLRLMDDIFGDSLNP